MADWATRGRSEMRLRMRSLSLIFSFDLRLDIGVIVDHAKIARFDSILIVENLRQKFIEVITVQFLGTMDPRLKRIALDCKPRPKINNYLETVLILKTNATENTKGFN